MPPTTDVLQQRVRTLLDLSDGVGRVVGQPRRRGRPAVGPRACKPAAGVHVVVNARTDVFLRTGTLRSEKDRVDRAIERLTAAAQAGADVHYPVDRRFR